MQAQSNQRSGYRNSQPRRLGRRLARFEQLETRALFAGDFGELMTAGEDVVLNDTPATATDLGQITAAVSVADSVGSPDLHDYYKFTTATEQDIRILLSGPSVATILEVYRDDNGTLTRIGQDLTQPNRNHSLLGFVDLQAGTYYVHVQSFFAFTNYDLSVGPAGVADLELSAGVLPTAVPVGEINYFTFQLINKGSDAATNVQVATPPFPGVTIGTALTQQGTFNPNTGIWNVGTVAPGQSLTFFVGVTTTVQANSLPFTADVFAVDQLDPDSIPHGGGFQDDDHIFHRFDSFIPNDAHIETWEGDEPEKVLVVNGTNAMDRLVIIQLPGNRIQVRNQIRNLGTFSLASIDRIAVSGFDGNDLVTIDPRLALEVYAGGGEGNDIIFGGGGNDILVGQNGRDYLLGGQGNDQLFGGEGVDVIFGGMGDDYIDTGADADLASGDAGQDVMYGWDGNDILYGGAGRDVMIGGAGTDLLLGQSDDDVLIGGNATLGFETWPTIQAQLGAISNFNARMDFLDEYLTAETVLDDGAQDTLDGGIGRDWYLDYALADLRLNFNTIPVMADRLN